MGKVCGIVDDMVLEIVLDASMGSTTRMLQSACCRCTMVMRAYTRAPTVGVSGGGLRVLLGLTADTLQIGCLPLE